jgi:glycosyltransferase involved in cell wall biosynthesis
MKQMPPTLVILTPGFPENEADSTCLPAQQLLVRAMNLHHAPLKIIIVSFQYPFQEKEYAWYGNRVIPLNGKNRNKAFRLLTWLRAWKALGKIKKQNNVIGLLSFWCTECALIGSRFGKKKGIRHHTWILGQDARKSNRFVRWIKPDSDSLVSMSAFLSDEFYKNHGIRPAHMIPNGIDVSLYPHQKKKRDIDILGAGSLIPLKQFDQFVQIAGELSLRVPNLKVMLCGKGPEDGRLMKMVYSLRLEEVFTLAGELPHTALLELMCRSKVFLHTSSYEGFSTVCLEALYAGAQVISFCSPGIGSVSRWHVVGNADEMLDLAYEIITDPDPVYEPVLLYSMSGNAKKWISLFA